MQFVDGIWSVQGFSDGFLDNLLIRDNKHLPLNREIDFEDYSHSLN